MISVPGANDVVSLHTQAALAHKMLKKENEDRMTFCFEIRGRVGRQTQRVVFSLHIIFHNDEELRTFIYDQADRQNDSVNASVAIQQSVKPSYITLRNKVQPSRKSLGYFFVCVSCFFFFFRFGICAWFV